MRFAFLILGKQWEEYTQSDEDAWFKPKGFKV